jgi:hypothetical protein
MWSARKTITMIVKKTNVSKSISLIVSRKTLVIYVIVVLLRQFL